MKNNKILLGLKNIIFTSGRKPLLTILSFQITSLQTIGVLGSNGSGKSLLAGILAGEIPGKGREKKYGAVLSGDLKMDSSVELVSFGEQELVMSREKYYDDTEFMHGAKDPGRTVKTFICGAPAGSTSLGSSRFVIKPGASRKADELIRRFGLAEKSERGLRYLSTGEFRKTLLCRSLFRKPDLLILDDPFSGLDAGSVEDLKISLKELHGELSVLILSGRFSDIPEWADRLAVISEGNLSEAAGLAEGKSLWDKLVRAEGDHLAAPGKKDLEKGNESPGISEPGPVIISMSNVGVSYMDIPILRDVNWRVRKHEHWQIAGPNGSGKSTLLSLITGDNPKAYGQDIALFGRKKGTGESVWEIKQKIGFVSGAFHLGYLKGQTIIGVILSGFFDTIGLYDKPDPVQIETALGWCSNLDLDGNEKVGFGELSFGLQRSVLIARAMIKKPDLLILDEPCQGLDDAHTAQVLKTAEFIASAGLSTILYVSHREEQRLPSINSFLTLVPVKNGGFTPIIHLNST